MQRDYYSVPDLVALSLPGYPRSRQGWYGLVERDNWDFVEVESKGGKGGIRREYRPPEALLELIRARQRGESVSSENPPSVSPMRARYLRSQEEGRESGGGLDFDRAYADLRPYARDALFRMHEFRLSKFNISKLRALQLLPALPEGSTHAMVVKKRIKGLVANDSDKRALSAWFWGDSCLARDEDDTLDKWLTGEPGPIEAIEILFCVLLFRVSPRWLLTGEGAKDYLIDPLSAQGVFDLNRAWPLQEIVCDALEGDPEGLSSIPEVLAKCLTAAKCVLGNNSTTEEQADLGIRLHGALRRLYPYSAKLHEALAVEDLEHLGRFVLATVRLLPIRR